MAKKKRSKAANSSGKKQKGSSSPRVKIDVSVVIRWLVAFVAFFMILTFFPVIDIGWLGGAVSGFFKGLFGPMYYVVPFIIIIIDVCWKRDRESGVAWKKYLLYALEFIFLSIIVQVAAAGDGIEFKDLYSTGKELQSAGLISGAVAMLFTATIGNIASTVLALLGIILCTLFLFGTTPKATFDAIKNFFVEAAEEDKEPEEEITVPEFAERKLSRREKRRIEAEDLNRKKAFKLPDDPLEKFEPVGNAIPQNPAPGREQIAAEPFVSEVNPKPAHREVPAEPDEILNPPEPGKSREEPRQTVVEEEDELYLEPVEDTPYVFPPISLLTEGDPGNVRPSQAEIDRTSRKLEEILASFNVRAKVINCTCGPTVTRYELQPETGVRVKAISNLSEDIALHLAASSVRIENIPGKVAVGIEIPNKTTFTVRLRKLIENPAFRDNKSRLYTALGEDVAGNPVYLDIAKMPHLLIAGATGMGKSVCINSLIVSLLYRNHPNDVKLILIDPKKVEFQPYNDLPHLLVPVITEPKSAAGTLNWACSEMENRYNLIQEVGVRDLAGYNNMIVDDPERQPLPQIVIIIDELADLMMTAPDDVETSICRLAQKARAAGIHLVIGTQRPSVDVVTGLIKANVPSRIAFTVASQVDSRTILDTVGAEKLLGRGDMLYYPVGAMKPIRVQGAFVDDKSELAAITQFIREAAVAHYDESIMQQIEHEAKLCGMKGKKGAAAAETADDGDDRPDPMMMDAIEVAIECGTVSTSLLQRRLSLGYARAARIIDKMERKGFIGQFDSATKKRSILITREQFLEMKLNGMNGEKNDAEG